VSPAFTTPRLLHPGAWWLWALGLATAAARTTNPLLLALIAAAAAVVVVERRVPGPWGRSYAAFLKFGLLIVALRVLLELVIGAADTGAVLFTLPQAPLPEWMAGVQFGGPVTVDGLLFAVYDGLRLAVMLACFGAANALVNPSRLLRIVPAALYEAGVAVVVCLTVAPILISDAGRIRAARRLRGRPTGGPRAWGQMAMPLFSGALDRSVALAASMDSRGYGRSAEVPWVARRINSALVVVGLLGVVVGLYGLLDGSTPGVAGVAVIGWPMLLLGAALALAGSMLAGRRVSRTRYRPDPFAAPEWLVAACGLAAGAAFVVLGSDPALLGPTSPPGWPQVPPAALAAVLVAALPAVLSPPVPGRRTPPAPAPDRREVAA
jgi:energy-coupling factor transport system permease protein